MKITKNYINLLRYTSVMGKNCCLETLPYKTNNFKQAGLKYACAAEYKTLPITTPLKMKLAYDYSIYYDTFETYHLAAGESQSSVHNNWFTMLEP